MYTRKRYLEFLIQNRNNERVKVLGGMRGSGKTQILADYRAHLTAQGVPTDRIFYADLSQPAYRSRSPQDIFRQIYDTFPDGRRAYIFLDDILRFEGCEVLADRLFRIADFDLYLAADGAPRLPKKLQTALPGRCLFHPVFPLSYAEIVKKPSLASFLSYAEAATLPVAFGTPPETAQSLLDASTAAVLYHEVLQDSRIRKTTIEKILAVLSPKVGDTMTIEALLKEIGRNGRAPHANTIRDHIKALEASGLLLCLPSCDIESNAPLSEDPDSFRTFFTDPALMRIFGEGSDMPRRQILSAVATELHRRADRVLFAETEPAPIDFIAQKDGLETICQCIPRADAPDAAAKIKTLADAPSRFKKIILTMTPEAIPPKENILIEFLPTWMGKEEEA